MCPLGEQEDYFLTVFSPWVEGPIYLSLVGVSQIGWKKYLDLGVVSSRASLGLSTLLERRKSIEKLKLAKPKLPICRMVLVKEQGNSECSIEAVTGGTEMLA